MPTTTYSHGDATQLWAGNGWFFERQDFQERNVNFWVVFSEKQIAFCQFGRCHFPVNSNEFEIWYLTIHTHYTYSKLDVNPWHMTRAPCFKASTTLAFGLEMLMNLSFYLCTLSRQLSKQCSCKTQSTKPEAKNKKTVDSTPYSFLQLTLYSI